MKTFTLESIIRAKQALKKAVSLHITDTNVSLIDIGFRIHDQDQNRVEPELTVRVHVHRKLRGADFASFAEKEAERVISAERIGFAVDVIEASYNAQVVSNDHSGFTSITVYNNLTKAIGTVGGIVCDRFTKEEMILGSWSTLCGSWTKQSDLSIHQNGIEAHAHCTRHSVHRFLDAAAAKLTTDQPQIKNPHGVGAVTGGIFPRLGMKVIKSGSISGAASGIIDGICGYALINLGGIRCIVRNLVRIVPGNSSERFCTRGDSGAWWIDQSTRRAVALHSATSKDTKSGLAYSMPEVLKSLSVDIFPNKDCSVRSKSCQKLTTQPLKTGDETSENLNEIKRKVPVLPTIFRQLILTHTLLKRFFPLKKINRFYNFDWTPMYNFLSSFWKLRIPKFFKKTAVLCFLIVLWISVIKISYHPIEEAPVQSAKIDRIQLSVSNITRMIETEKERQKTIGKIVTIIDSHNPLMEPKLKNSIAREIYEMSLKYSNLDIELICATITHESALTWEPNVVSPAGALGLMQIIPRTGVRLASEENIVWNSPEEVLFNPIYNIRMGCRYLSSLIESYCIDGGLAAYNGGEKRAREWIVNGRSKGILHEETEFYVPSILKIYAQYQSGVR